MSSKKRPQKKVLRRKATKAASKSQAKKAKASTGKAGSSKTSGTKSTTPKAAGKKTATKKASTKASKGTRVSTTKSSTASSGTRKKAATKKAGATKAAATKKAAKTTKKVAKKTTRMTKATAGTPATKKATKKKKKAAVKEAPLTVAERPTEELWFLYRDQAAKTGPKEAKKLEDLRNILIERHYPLVKYIAERLLQTLPKSIELDDLISAGLFGLMDAIRGFDASRGIKFKTYCSTRVRGAILDQLRSQDWVPRLVRLKASKIERSLQKLTAEYGREPTHSELAKSLEMEHGDLVREMQESRAKTMFSLSEKWEDDDGSVEKVEVLEDKTAIDPVHELNRRDLMQFITRSLTHKERFIIEQYYQFGHTMREIGEMLALTESRVCQIHSNVMSRLKGLLGQKQGSLSS